MLLALFPGGNAGGEAMERMQTLLIVDDEAAFRRLLVGHFSSRYSVLGAGDGAEALMLAVDRRPDLVLLDVSLPLIDGRTVCQRLKTYPATAGVPVIMLTGRTTQHDRHLGFEVGADDYLEKPVELAYLERAVERRLVSRRLPARLSPAEGGEPEGADAERGSWRWSEGTVRMRGA